MNIYIDQIKENFCRYKCKKEAKEETVFVAFDYSAWCPECKEYHDEYVEKDVILDSNICCDICPIDDFIRELYDYKIINDY